WCTAIRGPFQRRLHPADTCLERLRRDSLARAVDEQRKGEGRRAPAPGDDDARGGQPLERATQPRAFELALEHFAVRLGYQQVARVEAAEHVKEEARRRLQLSRGLAGSGKAGEDEAGDPRNLPELALRHLGRVERRGHVVEQVARYEQSLLQRLLQWRLVRREQLHAVVVHGEREADRLQPRDAVRQQRGQPLVYEPALERVDVVVVPFARVHMLDQKLVAGRDVRPLALELEYGPYGLHLRTAVLAACGLLESPAQQVRELARKRQPCAHPARYRPFCG